MRREILDILRCPKCRGELTLEVYEESQAYSEKEIVAGLLSCGCGARYAVWRGVPRMLLPKVGMPRGFVEKFRERLIADMRNLPAVGTLDDFSFSVEWSMYRHGDLSWELTLKERVDYFHYYLSEPRGSLKGKLVLDAGCGNGTLSAAIAAEGARVVAMDLSNAVEQAQQQAMQFSGDNRPQLCYVQADVQHPPFDDETFDIAYSDGVLHHTDSTKKSFDALAPLVKLDGRFFVWLYRDEDFGLYTIKVKLARAIGSLLSPLPLRVVKTLCYVGAVILVFQLRVRHIFGFRRRRIIPIWLKAVNLFDTFTPKYAHRQAPEEVQSWYKEHGYLHVVERTIPELGPGGFGVLGTKGNADAGT